MSENSSLKWAAIILAAGSSSRMGQSKQLISIAGETLLNKTINTVTQVGAVKTVVVIGANHQAIKPGSKSEVVEFIYNQQWENGMGNSLKFGLNHVMTHFREIEAALFLVCDQPLLDVQHLRKIVETFEQTKSPIVASFYSGKNGVPVLFHKSMFLELLNIDNQQGAKKIIELNSTLVKSVDFPNGAFDLDTPEDLREFENRRQGI